MIYRLFNFLKYLNEGTCPDCGLFTSLNTQCNIEERERNKLFGDVCMNELHDTIVEDLEYRLWDFEDE